MLTLTVLGSGTAVPEKGRRAPAFSFHFEDNHWMIDCGAGATGSLVDQGAKLDSLTGVLLTHLHPDHTADLVSLMFAYRSPGGPKRTAPLKLWGPTGTRAHVDALRGVYGDWLDPHEGPKPVAEDLDAGEFVVSGPLTITPVRVEHSGVSFAYRIRLRDLVVVYSGDTGMCDGIVEAARGADMFFCECGARTDDKDVSGHLNARQVGQIAQQAGVKAVVLTHLKPSVLDEGPLAMVRKHFGGRAETASDGMTLQLDAERRKVPR